MLGLTNYSRWSDAAAVRACMAESADLGSSLLPAALASLQKFVHVGVTEQLEASIQSLAATMGMQMDGPSWEVRVLMQVLLWVPHLDCLKLGCPGLVLVQASGGWSGCCCCCCCCCSQHSRSLCA